MNKIPENYLDLVNCPRVAALTTIMPDGRPQTTVVWCDFDGEFVQGNTMRGFRKEKNMRVNPKVPLLIVDPEDTSRYVEIRGDVEIIFDNAIEHLDRVTRRYTRHPRYYGYVYPTEQEKRETRIICIIHARKITLDAIHR